MLENYDAKAVAEVMGIAFLEERDSRPKAPPKPAKTAKSSKAVVGVDTRKFVISVDHDPVRIVEIRTEHTYGHFEKSIRGVHKNIAIHSIAVRTPSPVLIEKAVEKGLPRLALRHVAEQIAGTDKAKISSLEWVIVPKTTLERREEQLSPLESERTERVARLFVHARRALGSEAEAREFMTGPHPQLEGRAPIDAAKTDLGARRTEQILNALEYGLAL